MRKLILACILTIAIGGTAQADLTTFDFDSATIGGSPNIGGTANQYVSEYMTNLYGSSVTSTGAAAWQNAQTAPKDLDWPTKTSTDKWLRSYGAVGYTQTPGVFQISFDEIAIQEVSGDFHVFVETEGHDFTVKAYDSSYGDRYAPDAGALIDEYSWFSGTGSSSFSLDFASPVSLLVFSDGGYYDVAIDNLQVTPVPVPGAMLLTVLGLGIVGAKRRQWK